MTGSASPIEGIGRVLIWGVMGVAWGCASAPDHHIEVTNAQHFDAFLAFAGYSERMVPLHRYFIQAMDMMYANLKSGAALPASQVGRTVPRGLNGAGANPITPANVPPIQTMPAAADQITFANNVLTIAD